MVIIGKTSATPICRVTLLAGSLLFAAGCATPKPRVAPVPGLHACPILVTMTDQRPGAAIYYTIDGSAPNLSSKKYSEPLSISATEGVRAIAAGAGEKPSAEVSNGYQCALTRGQFAVLLQKQYHLPPPATPLTLPDVNANRPDYAAIQASWTLMNTQMLCPTCQLRPQFYPDDAIYREGSSLAIVQVLLASGKIPLLGGRQSDAVLARVPDASKLSAMARPYIATAINAGILPLSGGNTIQPARLQTQQDVLAIFEIIQRKFDFPPARTVGAVPQ